MQGGGGGGRFEAVKQFFAMKILWKMGPKNRVFVWMSFLINPQILIEYEFNLLHSSKLQSTLIKLNFISSEK